MNNTLLQLEPDHKAKGINADYLGLMQKNLKVNIVLRVYPRAKDTAYALEKGDVDIMLTDLLTSRPQDNALNISKPLITTFPVLVTTINNTMSPLTSNKSVKIARVKGYPSNTTIFHSFPNAIITDYDDHYEALASVSAGNNQYFIGSNIITSTLISQYFTHSLNSIKYYNSPCQYVFFVTRKGMSILPDILDRFIRSLTNEVRKDVVQNWLNSGNLGYINQPLELTSREKYWIKNHPFVKVLVPSFHPPFTMKDEQGVARGMLGDMLNIIELQTGMKFVSVSPTTPFEDMHLLEGKWDILPGVIRSEKLEQQVALTDTIMVSPYVYVMKKKRHNEQRIMPGMTIGLPTYYGLDNQLKARHPEVKWVSVSDASAAFHLVQEGKLDALVATQPTAQYMLDHYYPNSQFLFRIPDFPRASISFALPRSEPEL